MAVEPLLAAQREAERAERHRDVIEKIRSRTDLTAKGLGAIGTAAISAVGYGAMADLFPYGGPGWAVLVLVAGTAGMIAAVILLTERFSAAGEAVTTTPDLQETIELNKLDPKEEEIVRQVYGEMAKLNEVDSLVAYQVRGHRFERIADRLDEGSSLVDSLRIRADLVMNEVVGAQTRVSALIVKKRAKEATSGAATLWLVLLFLGGWYLMAYSADKLESERVGQIEVAKACAEARQKGATNDDLPDICGEKPESDAKLIPAAKRGGETD